MQTTQVGIHVPGDLDFSELRLKRDPDGHISFDWAPIERLCKSNGLDVALFREGPEDNLAALLVAWYQAHLTAGGGRDPVQDDLLLEVMAEDRLGGGFSFQPGQA